MKKIYIAIISILLSGTGLQAQEQDTVRLTLKEAINLAQMQSVDAAVALNELKTAYWEYRTHIADQLPEINFKGTLPAYSKQYTKYQQSDGSYTFVQNNSLGLNGEISIDQNIALTGGKISLNSSLDFNRQLGKGGGQRIYERTYRVDAYAADFRCERPEMEKAYRACPLSGSESRLYRECGRSDDQHDRLFFQPAAGK